MTPLTKRRWSTRRQGQRRATIKLALPSIVKCKNCGQDKKANTICKNCKQ